jgi:hypothetical protein
MAASVVGKHHSGGRFGDNKRTVIVVAVGLAIIVLLLGYKMFSGGGSSSTPMMAPVTAAPAGQAGTQPIAKAVPAAAKPGPAPNTSRDPFKPLR